MEVRGDGDGTCGNGGTEGVASAPTSGRGWPAPPAKIAFRGLAGDWVRLIDPHTESDMSAVLIQFLVAFGSAVGRGPHAMVESDRHACNLFAGMVGETAKARKGTSWGRTAGLFELVDEQWARKRVMGGLSSGEGLIWQVRDAIERLQPIREKGRVAGYESVKVDAGESDKRLLVLESELSSPLRVMAREGNTLSEVIRQAWDKGNLRSLSKNCPAVATDAHISVIGHITRDELGRELTAIDMANGFANRFLWAAVRRSKVLPEGGRLDEAEVRRLAEQLGRVLRWARCGAEIGRDDRARGLWAERYLDLSEGQPGLLGAVTSRAEAQVTRLSLIYALLAERTKVAEMDLQAALAVWDYCERSASYIFGKSPPSETEEERDRRQLVEFIRGRGGRVTARDLARGPRRYRETRAAEEALIGLAHARLGHWEDVRPATNGGRPTRAFLLSPEAPRDGDTTAETAGKAASSVPVAGADLVSELTGEVRP